MAESSLHQEIDEQLPADDDVNADGNHEPTPDGQADGGGGTGDQTGTPTDPEPNAGAGDDDGDDGQPYSLADLAAHLETDPESLHSVQVPTNVLGQAGTATIGDLLTKHQQIEAGDQYLANAKTEAKQIKESAAAEAAQVTENVASSAALVLTAEKLLTADIEATDLAKLRDEDHSRYLIEKDRLTEARNAIDKIKAQVKAGLEQQFDQQNQPPTQEQMQACATAMIERLPELGEQAARGALGEYLLAEGFETEEIRNTVDPRLFVLGEKARRYDEIKAKGETASKRKVKFPKKMKPGAAKQTAAKPKPADGDHASVLYPND